jgi:hypothetical protein
MKTSNKILLGLIITVLFINFGLLTYFRLKVQGNIMEQGTSMEPGHRVLIVSDVFEMGNFHKLESNFPGRIYFHPSVDGHKVVMKMPDSDKMAKMNIKANVEDGVLNIAAESQDKDYRMAEVHIYGDSLTWVKLDKVTRFEADRMNAYHCDIEVVSGSFLAGIGMGECRIKAYNGAMLTIDGNVGLLRVEAFDGSVVNATALTVGEAYIKSGDQAVVELENVAALNIDINTQSILSFKGNPQMKNMKIEGGAQLVQK